MPSKLKTSETQGSYLPERLWLIDDLRGIAAVLIVVFHYHHFYLADAFDRPNLPPLEEFPGFQFFGFFYSPWAAKAVELFWVISGVVFAHVYHSRRTGLWAFTIARVARLYPLHFVMLIGVLALQVASMELVGHPQTYGNNDLKHFLLHLAMMSNSITLSEGLSFNGPFWSVSLEIPIYGVFFLSLALFRKYPLMTAFVMSASCWTIAFGDIVPLRLVRESVFECGGYFFTGAFIWALVRNARCRSWQVAGAFVSACAAWLTGAYLGYTILATAGGCSALVIAALMGDMIRRADRGIIPVLGNLSYSIYMIHVPLQISLLLFMDLFVGRDRSFAESPYTLPSYLLLTILLAFLIYRHFERPMDRAIRRVCLQGSTRDMQRQTGLIPNEAIPITKADNKEQT